jgi:hypothetical protein
MLNPLSRYAESVPKGFTPVLITGWGLRRLERLLEGSEGLWCGSVNCRGSRVGDRGSR